MWKDRTKLLIGEDGIDKLASARVCVIGLGGVGGYVCHLLARAGIEHLTLVDFDVVDETNINRQIVADSDVVGRLKTEVLKEQLLKINPKCQIVLCSERFNESLAEKLFSKHFEYVVDAIDSVTDKLTLISYCKEHDINIVSAMGAGNRAGIPHFEILDVYKTKNDGLAKVMRKKLRDLGINKLDVACCDELPDKIDRRTSSVGSISYYPAMCGCVIAGFVINQLIK